MRRSLIHFWRMNLAVVAGAAVATAVLTGALLVGESVRESLRGLTLERLGGVDLSLVSERLFGEALAARLESHPDFSVDYRRVVPAMVLPASAVHAESRARASRVTVYGVDDRFSDLFAESGDPGVLDLERSPDQNFPSLLVNEALRRELGAEIGDSILLAFQGHSEVPRESLLGSKRPEDVVDTWRLTLSGVLPDRGVGRFGLAPNQVLPLNAFVSLPEMQRARGVSGRVNALLVSAARAAPASAEGLQAMLRDVVELEDLGLTVRRGDGYLSVESQELILRPGVEELVQRLASDAQAPMLPVLTYLANSMRIGDRELPYSTVTALNTPVDDAFGILRLVDGGWVPSLKPGQIVLNAWAAQDLGAAVGDELRMSYYKVGSRDELRTEAQRFRVAGIAALEGLGADRELTPELPGIADAEDMSGWDPPFPVDLSRVGPRDEAYWDRFRGTPKAFVALEEGRSVWRSRFGELTSIRLAEPAAGGLAELEELLQQGLRQGVDLEAASLSFQPVKQQGLRAASGATDFSGLFFGFSLFLIVSAAVLVGLLFSLAVEQRAGELGLRLAVGYPVRAVRNQLLAEGGLLAAIGALLGLGLAVLYAALVLVGLGSWWAPLLDSPILGLSVSLNSLALGYLISVGLVVFAIAWTVRRLRRIPARALLVGSVSAVAQRRRRSLTRWIAVGSLSLAAILLLAAILAGATSSPAFFFSVGAALLVAGIAFFALWCRDSRGGLERSGVAVLAGMAARNSGRNSGRSLLSVVLVGCACFVLVTVAANRRDFSRQAREKASGTGGFALVAEADIPLRQDLGRPASLLELGFSEAAVEELAGVTNYPLRLLPGEDTSCLNLYQPERPRVLGVGEALIRRGGFRFRGASEEVENPWTLLEQDLGPGVIPAVGDYNSARWILHLGLGQDLVLEDDHGQPVKLRMVGLLETSIFQSELLISESAFLRHFPDHGGYAYFLIETPPDRSEAVAELLEAELGRFGFDATSALEKLAGYQAVENAYLSTFQVLGGLGLLLGTLGLGIVLIRNVMERRGELATLRAFGYRRSTLAWMVVAENGFLLVVGIVVGSLAGLIAVAPHIAAGSVDVPWASLATTLAVVFVVGMLASAVAVVATLRVPLLPVLKAE